MRFHPTHSTLRVILTTSTKLEVTTKPVVKGAGKTAIADRSVSSNVTVETFVFPMRTSRLISGDLASRMSGSRTGGGRSGSKGNVLAFTSATEGRRYNFISVLLLSSLTGVWSMIEG